MRQGRSGAASFTFAVVGRDEAKTLAGMLEQAQQAAHPGDRVWFVDSASQDDSALLARRLGVEVIEAPAGKGRAMAAALDRCREGYVCFIDADLSPGTSNIAATLRAATVQSGAAMVVGAFTSDRRTMITPWIYWPLVDALFPDYRGPRYPRPLSGLRVIDATVPVGEMPPGYGVEAHLNLAVAATGHAIAGTELGEVRNPLRGYANLHEVAVAVTAAILDFAVAQGRLERDYRTRWDQWAGDVLDLLRAPPPPGAAAEEFTATLALLVERPFPPGRKSEALGPRGASR